MVGITGVINSVESTSFQGLLRIFLVVTASWIQYTLFQMVNQDRYPIMRSNRWRYSVGDLDHDSDVDISDLAQLLSNYGTTEGATYEMGDLDGDVDLGDLSQLLAHYGMTSGATYQDGDLDGDGDVDLSDLGALLAWYGFGT